MGFAVAFGPVLEFDDESAIGGALAGKETVAINHLAFSYGGVLSYDFVGLFENFTGAFLGRARGEVDHAEEYAGVFVGDECGGGDGHQVYEYGYGGAHDAEACDLVASEECGRFLVALEHGIVPGIEGCMETFYEALLLAFGVLVRFKEHSTQGRGEGKGVDGREEDGYGHGEAELLVEHAGGARDE